MALAGAVIVLAGCSQDPSGPATVSGAQPIDRTADAKTPTGITIRLFAYDAAAAGVAVSFTTSGGGKLTDFTLASAGGTSGIPSSINVSPLAAGSYSVTAHAPAGFAIFQSYCGVSEGSSLVVPDATFVSFVLIKKGWGYCDFTVGAQP